MFSPDKPFPVYESQAWHSDQWNAQDSAKEVNFDLPFLEQLKNLQACVPRISTAGVKNQNCPYINQVWNCKNVYLGFDMGFCEDALYCYATYHSKNVADSSFTRKCELSYNLIDCTKCYNSWYLQDCGSCYNTYFSFDCNQCHNIAFCYNLRNKENHLFNKQVSEEEFENFIKELQSGSYSKMQEKINTFQLEVASKAIRKSNHIVNCDNCSGDYILNSRNCQHCFDCDASDELKYCNRVDEKVVTSMDLDSVTLAEMAYEGTSIAGHRIIFCNASWDPSNSNLLYCDTLQACENCFGCISLKHKDYCILNKQYTKEEYEELVPKIIEKMQADGEWGEFFPVELSPFAYNETVAQEYFPMTKEEVEAKGWKWKDEVDEMPQVEKIIPANKLPDSIDDIPDDILNWAVECEATQRPFRIVKQELEFYRRMKIPIPHFHPDERHKRRMTLRNPRKLWERKCDKCNKEIQTTYAPEKPETVFCEECYLKEVY